MSRRGIAWPIALLKNKASSLNALGPCSRPVLSRRHSTSDLHHPSLELFTWVLSPMYMTVEPKINSTPPDSAASDLMVLPACTETGAHLTFWVVPVRSLRTGAVPCTIQAWQAAASLPNSLALFARKRSSVPLQRQWTASSRPAFPCLAPQLQERGRVSRLHKSKCMSRPLFFDSPTFALPNSGLLHFLLYVDIGQLMWDPMCQSRLLERC